MLMVRRVPRNKLLRDHRAAHRYWGSWSPCEPERRLRDGGGRSSSAQLGVDGVRDILREADYSVLDIRIQPLRPEFAPQPAALHAAHRSCKSGGGAVELNGSSVDLTCNTETLFCVGCEDRSTQSVA